MRAHDYDEPVHRDALTRGAAVDLALRSPSHPSGQSQRVQALTDVIRIGVATNSGPIAELANPATPIRSFVTETDTVYYRVFSGDSTTGGFLTSAPPGISAEAISGMALPPGNQATMVQEVLVPAGTRLQSSIASEAFEQNGGWLQFELLDRIPLENFGPGRPIG
jgi:hypothetical protein